MKAKILTYALCLIIIFVFTACNNTGSSAKDKNGVYELANALWGVSEVEFLELQGKKESDFISNKANINTEFKLIAESNYLDKKCDIEYYFYTQLDGITEYLARITIKYPIEKDFDATKKLFLEHLKDLEIELKSENSEILESKDDIYNLSDDTKNKYNEVIRKIVKDNKLTDLPLLNGKSIDEFDFTIGISGYPLLKKTIIEKDGFMIIDLDAYAYASIMSFTK